MNYVVRILICCLVGFSCLETNGQNEFLFGHYMLNPGYFNPAFTGESNEAFVTLHHRTQWAGYNASLDPGGVPTTQMASLSAPVDGFVSGLGFFFINDETGPMRFSQARLAIALKKQINKGYLSIGLMPSFNLATINADLFRFDDPDNLIPSGKETQYQPNLHLGVLFKSHKNLFIGASVENAIEPSFDFGAEASNTLERNYYLTGGAEKVLTRNTLLKPYFLIRSDLNTYTYELSAILEHREKMWGGISYRSEESATILIGYSFLEDNKLKLGYSFDYVVTNSEAKEDTSHEVYLRYNLPNLVFGGRKAIKTPRFNF